MRADYERYERLRKHRVKAALFGLLMIFVLILWVILFAALSRSIPAFQSLFLSKGAFFILALIFIPYSILFFVCYKLFRFENIREMRKIDREIRQTRFYQLVKKYGREAVCKCALDQHNWNGCKCKICGQTRDEGHDWNGCKCRICGQTRDEGHEFVGCKCKVCGKTIHKMMGCRCAVCGEIIHKFDSNCRCIYCGETVHNWSIFEKTDISNAVCQMGYTNDHNDCSYGPCEYCSHNGVETVKWRECRRCGKKEFYNFYWGIWRDE